jgi:hypothetical protein
LENRISLRETLKTKDELEEEVQKFVTDIQQSAWEAMSFIIRKVK